MLARAARSAPMANTTAWTASRTAAATVLNAETTSTATQNDGGDPGREAGSADVDLGDGGGCGGRW